MGYKVYKIKELKEMCCERKLDHKHLSKKHEFINLLEKDDKKNNKDTNCKKEGSAFGIKEIKELNKIEKSISTTARKTNNVVDDIVIDIMLEKSFGKNYDKKLFAKIENNLEMSNISVNFTNDEFREEISIVREDFDEISEEEINYSIDSVLKGIVKSNSKNDEVKNFLSTINDYPMLTREQEDKVCKSIDVYKRKVEKGEEISFLEQEIFEADKELLALSNKRLVVSIAKKYTNRGMDLIDLVMEGMIGLDKAISKYDYETGNKFSTYATWWIRQGITRAIADKSKVIRVPVHMVETINKVHKLQRELLQKNGVEPTSKEIGELLDPPLEAEKVEYIFNISKDPVPLEMPIGGENSTLEAFVEDDKHLTQEEESEKNELRYNLLEIISEIPEKEGEVLLLRYGLYDLDTDSLEKKIVAFQEIFDKYNNEEINAFEIENYLDEIDCIPEYEKRKYIKRFTQNNEHFVLVEENINTLSRKKDKKTKAKIEKLKIELEATEEKTAQFLEKIIENTQDKIQQLEKISEMNDGIVKALTLEEVGEVFNVTRERIRQIETKGKRKLKAFANKHKLKLFL